jgi:TRAP-type C4-dicarboxylate transport system permease small subunit
MKARLKFFQTYWLEFITCSLLFSMVALVSISVVLRYIFSTGILWSEEFVRYAYIWLIFLGSVTAIKQNAHIGLDIVTKRLPLKLKCFIYCLGDALVMFFLLIQIIYGFDLILKTQGMLSSTMRLPMSWVYYVFPLSGILMQIEMLRLFYRHLKMGEKK